MFFQTIYFFFYLSLLLRGCSTETQVTTLKPCLRPDMLA